MRTLILTILTISFGTLFISSIAQNLEEYNWGEAKYAPQDNKYKNNDQVYIKRVQKVEYNFNDTKKAFSQITMSHFVIQINTEKGLKLRKELEPPSETKKREVLEFKARIIHPNGTFYEFKKSDLKEKKVSQREKIKEDDDEDSNEDEDDDDEKEDDDDEDGKEPETYTYYDLSDLKIGSQIEFYFIIKSENPSMSGTLLNYQSRIPIQQFFYEINATKEFTFLIKSYNGAPNAIKDSTNKVRMVYQLKDQMVDAFPKEKFSNFGANVRGFIYKLDGYELGKKKNIFNNEEMSRNLFKYIYTLDKKELSVAKKVIKQAKLKSYKTDPEKIVALENYIKTNFGIFNIGALNYLFNIENLYRLNSISGENAARLMANILNMLKIEHELVLACNRFDYRYDKDFESNFFMDRFMFYFPNQKKFMDPNTMSLRLGFLPSGFTHNNALFIRSVTAGGVTSGVGKIKFIDAMTKDESVDKLDIKVNIAGDTKSANIEMTRTMTGYFSADWQPFFRKLDAEQRVKYDNSLFKFIDEKMETFKTEYINTDLKDIGVKPFIVKGKGESTELMTQRGDTVVFKVGKLIGPQSDMYKETEPRLLPIERGSARTYDRVIEIELPSGFRVHNIDALNKKFELKNEKGQLAAVYKSSYELRGNTLIITIEEWYEDIILPASKFAEFKAIINAAADFAKSELKLLK